MESLIRQRLISNGELTSLVDERIYYAKAPADVDFETNYPQIVLSVDKFTDAMHGVAGLLSAEIICSQDTTPPEPIERLVRETLEGVFFRGNEIFILKWSKSDIFSEPASERMPLIVGAMMTFEIHEFPNVLTTTPDPILALQEWTANLGVCVIGFSDFGEIFIPTRDMPAFYFDVQRLRYGEQSHTTIWIDALIRGHVFAPDVHGRREWLTLFNQELLFCSHIFLGDGSPMRLQDNEIDFTANEIQGQVQMTFQYGIWRREHYAHPLIGYGTDADSKIRFRHSYDKRQMRRYDDVHDKGACESGSASVQG